MLIFIVNGFLLGIFYLSMDVLKDHSRQFTPWVFYGIYMAQAAFFVLYIVGACAIFFWKQWGFWLYLVASVIQFFILYDNLGGLMVAATSLLSAGVLYATLHMGRKKSTWVQLD